MVPWDQLRLCVIIIALLPGPCSHGFSCLVSSMPILWLDPLSSGAKNTKITIFPPLICGLLHSGLFSTVFQLRTCDTCAFMDCVTTTLCCILSHHFVGVASGGKLDHYCFDDRWLKLSLSHPPLFLLSLSLTHIPSVSLPRSQQHVNISQGFYQRASSRAPAGLPRRGGYRKS